VCRGGPGVALWQLLAEYVAWRPCQPAHTL
jgi:hypothetical protein